LGCGELVLVIDTCFILSFFLGKKWVKAGKKWVKKGKNQVKKGKNRVKKWTFLPCIVLK
jgi:hypothetical protein